MEKISEYDKAVNTVAKQLVSKAAEILSSKNDDYGWDNFVHAASIASFLTGQDIRPEDVAACLIGIKMARYRNLTITGAKPKNESVEDTVQDWINYVALMERERQRTCGKQKSAESESTVTTTGV